MKYARAPSFSGFRALLILYEQPLIFLVICFNYLYISSTKFPIKPTSSGLNKKFSEKRVKKFHKINLKN